MMESEQKGAIKAILFDLDGTLLQANMHKFIAQYIRSLAVYCAEKVTSKQFEKVLLAIIHDLIKTAGDGSKTNEERVYARIRQELSIPESMMRDCLTQFKQNDLEELREWVQPIPLAKQIVKECQEKGVPLVLATNPVFPRFIIQARMQWAGLEEDSFTYLTSYENSCYCKPQTGYFQAIVDRLGVAAENCLMVGNDFNHDLAAEAIGIKTYLVDTWLVDRGDSEWNCDYRGDHSSLQKFLREQLG
ncbi:MAG: HAD family hydrolase [Desulfuromusa sp.]|nr:HAD family hydrolase [Desulfuromusa sp.]